MKFLDYGFAGTSSTEQLACGNRERMRSTLNESERIRMKHHYLVSLSVHATLLLMVIAAGAFGIQKSPEMVTVVLNNDAFMAGGSGGDGKTPGSQVMERTEKRITREISKVKKHRKISLAGKPEEAKNKNVLKDAENDDVIPSNETSDLALFGKLAVAGVDPYENESEIGFGGGGTGVGGYGPGSGFGGEGKNGTGGTGKGYGTGSDTSLEFKKAQYLLKHFQYIRDLIMKNLTYPAQARRMGWKGRVTVSFIISEKGTVERIRIIKSSGYKILDENVAHTIMDVQPFPKPPVRAEIVIPVSYSLG